MIKIKSFNAGSGDAFHIYIPNEKFNIIIDGGFASTYDAEIKKTLQEIKLRGEELDLLVITHMCRDHINGIIKLIKENGSNLESKVIKIKEVWFNSYFNSPLSKKNIELSEEVLLKLKRTFRNQEDTYIGNIGINEAKTLTKLLLEGGYLINSSFHFKSINTSNIKSLKKGQIEFKFLSPSRDTLLKLDKDFNEKIGEVESEICNSYEERLNQYFENFLLSSRESSQEYFGHISKSFDIESLAKSEDIDKNTLNNEASIAFVIEYKNKKVVFLGDATLNIYEAALDDHYPNLSNTIFDLIKVSHHGSRYNISSEFLKKIKCCNFLISTDGSGSHRHPDVETISKIILDHKKNSNIIFNTENKGQFRWLNSINSDINKEKYKFNIKVSDYIDV